MFSTNSTRLVLIGLLAFVFFTCKTTEEVSLPPFVNPPIPGLDPGYTSFSFDTERDTVFQFTSGSSIRIPAHAFRYEDGSLVSGKVEVKYREFHDVSSVYLAGISMDYQKNGESFPFQTAGSFDIRANSDGKALQLDSTKNIGVKMASFESDDDYDFYYLNEGARQWDSIGFAQPEINLEKKKLKRKINRIKPDLAFPLNRKYFAFNYNIILDTYLDYNVKGADNEFMKKHLKKYGLGWENVETNSVVQRGETREWAGMVVWKNLSRKSIPKWAENLHAVVSPIKGDQYQVTVVSKDSSQVFQMKILYVMSLKQLFAFPPEKWRNNYEGTMAKIRGEEERLQLMADVYRDFEVSNLGIYNWDRIMKMEEKVELMANFNFEETINGKLTKLEVIFVAGDNKSIIKYPQYKWENLPVVPDDKGRFFSLLPGKKVAVFSAEEYSKLDFEELRKNPYHVFEMATATKVVNTEEDFRAVIGI